MKTDSGKGKKTSGKVQRERYLKVPYHILNIPNIGLYEKVLLSQIYGFGTQGCFQSNATLAKFFMYSPSTIKRWVAKLKAAHLVYFKCPRGYHRTMWAVSHPDVKAAVAGWKAGNTRGKKNAAAAHKRTDPRSKTDPTTGSKQPIPPDRNCTTINNNTIKEIKKDISAKPPPLPAGGQAAALLAERKDESRAKLEQLKKKFGLGKGKRSQPLSEKQFEKRRQRQLKCLLPTKQPKAPVPKSKSQQSLSEEQFEQRRRAQIKALEAAGGQGLSPPANGNSGQTAGVQGLPPSANESSGQTAGSDGGEHSEQKTL